MARKSEVAAREPRGGIGPHSAQSRRAERSKPPSAVFFHAAAIFSGGCKAFRSRQVKPATVNRELTLLKHMFAKAVEWKLLTTNPLRGVKSLNVPTRIDRVLELDEETKLLAACKLARSRFLQPSVILALHTGMRSGELLSLTWDQIDLLHRRIRILNAKTKSGQRSIPINSTAYALLSELARNKNSNLVFPSNRRVGQRFLDLKKGFKKAVQLAGIPPVRFHDLRHSFATRLVQAGVDRG